MCVCVHVIPSTLPGSQLGCQDAVFILTLHIAVHTGYGAIVQSFVLLPRLNHFS